MSSYFRKSFLRFLTLLTFNLVLLFFGVLLIEYFFGNWRGTRGPDRLNVPRDTEIHKDITDLYPSKTGVAVYKRDGNGLRGPFKNVSDIQILTLGGSTTDQSDLSEGETWQDVLAEDFRKDGKEIQIANAGIDGQSVLAHARSLKIWLSKIPDLHPKYVLAYIGINDTCFSGKIYHDYLKAENSWIALFKKKSALYYLYRTLRGMIIIAKDPKHHFISPKAVKEWTGEPRLRDYSIFQKQLNHYEKRLRFLLLRIRQFNANPIFITQKDYIFRDAQGKIQGAADTYSCWGKEVNEVDGYHIMEWVNRITLKVCREENLICYDLAKELDLKMDDFYDFEHNSPSGAAKIGHYLHKKMTPLFEEAV